MKIAKVYNTGDSQAVTHQSTNPALHSLTSVIRRELVHSVWCDRRRQGILFRIALKIKFRY